jgi:endonuclease YncB( thermonuclease family)
MIPQRTNVLLLMCALQYASSCVYLQGPVYAADFSDPIVSVLDGDTIEVLHHTHPERIRLNGIDRPEKRQAYGKRAKQAVSELVFGKDVTLQTYGKDK